MNMPSSEVALSVMIPNFNYAKYIGETIESVLSQAPRDLEIVVCDNASTDDSVKVVRSYEDARVRLEVNATNVGFAANLERVASLSRGRRMILLSSDDRMKPDAIDAYRRLETALGAKADRAIWGAASSVIDSQGNVTGRLEADRRLWRDATENAELSRAVGYRVLEISAAALLKRSLELLRSPMAFATTCYPKALHDEVGGYSGGRLINPDKWFLWKLLGVAETAYIIDHDLFDYRVHASGQAAQEARSGALKHLTDQYVATFNLPESVLQKAGLDREAIAAAFVEQDIALRGFVAVASGNRTAARRGVHFGLATYPQLTRKSSKVWLLRGLLALGPVGSHVARLAQQRARTQWLARESRPSTSTNERGTR